MDFSHAYITSKIYKQLIPKTNVTSSSRDKAWPIPVDEMVQVMETRSHGEKGWGVVSLVIPSCATSEDIHVLSAYCLPGTHYTVVTFAGHSYEDDRFIIRHWAKFNGNARHDHKVLSDIIQEEVKKAPREANSRTGVMPPSTLRDYLSQHMIGGIVTDIVDELNIPSGYYGNTRADKDLSDGPESLRIHVRDRRKVKRSLEEGCSTVKSLLGDSTPLTMGSKQELYSLGHSLEELLSAIQ